MKDFNWNRFTKTFSWYFMMKRSDLLRWMLGTMSGTLLLETLFLWMTSNHFYNYTGQNRDIIGLCCAFSVVIMVIGQSMWLQFDRKGRRQQMLMLPASSLEKWLAALLYAVVVWTVCVIASFAVGDALRGLLFMASRHEFLWAFPEVFKTWTGGHVYPSGFLAPVVYLYLFTLWVHSIYILGGTVIRRFSFVFVSLLLVFSAVGISQLDISFVHLGSGSFYEMTWDENANITSVTPRLFYYVHLSFFFICALFNYWLSLRVFRRIQLMNHKWINL